MSETLEKCVSPVCYEKFEPSGLDIKPKRYCSDGCKLDVYALRRVAKLLDGKSDSEKLDVLKASR